LSVIISPYRGNKLHCFSFYLCYVENWPVKFFFVLKLCKYSVKNLQDYVGVIDESPCWIQFATDALHFDNIMLLHVFTVPAIWNNRIFIYLIKWNGVLHEKGRLAQVVKKFPSTITWLNLHYHVHKTPPLNPQKIPGHNWTSLRRNVWRSQSLASTQAEIKKKK